MPTRLERIKEAITEAAREGTPAIHWLYGRGGAVQHASLAGFGMYLPRQQVAYDLSPLQAQKLANLLVDPDTEKHHLAVTTEEQRNSRANVYRFSHNHWWVPTTVEDVCLHWSEYGDSAGGASACFVTIGLPPGEYEDAGAAFEAAQESMSRCGIPPSEELYVDPNPVIQESHLIALAHMVLERCRRLNADQQRVSDTALTELRAQLEEIEYDFLTQRDLPFYIEKNRREDITPTLSRVLELAREHGRDLKLVQQTICQAAEKMIATLEAAAHDRELYRHHRPYYEQQTRIAQQGIAAADCGEVLSSRLAAAKKTLRRRYRLLPFSLPLRIYAALRDTVCMVLSR